MQQGAAPMNSRASLDDWMAVRLLRLGAGRSTDVFLCSVPKSGRTWLRFVISHYQIRLLGLDFELTLRNFCRISPNLSLTSKMGLLVPAADRRLHRIVATHSARPELFRGRRIIFLTRDLRDVVVSLFHHESGRGQFVGTLEEFVASPRGLPRLMAYVNAWAPYLQRCGPNHVTRIRYEEMHADPLTTLRRCVQFIGLREDEVSMREALEYGSRANMRRLETLYGTYDFTPSDILRTPDARQVRKGTVGGHAEELAPQFLAMIGDTIRSGLVDSLGYTY